MDQSAYVAGRYQDGNNFYAASLYNSNGGKLEIRKKVSGSTTTLATLDYPLATGTWYTVKLELFWIDDSYVCKWDFAAYERRYRSSFATVLASGGIGLVGYKADGKL